MTSLELAEWEAFSSLEGKKHDGGDTGEDDERPLAERIREQFSRLARKG